MIQQSTLPELFYNPVINYAMQQNHVPVVRKLVIKNDTSEDWQDITVTIDIEPDFAHSWQYRIGSVPAGGIIELDAIQITLRPQLLAELTERISGSIMLKALMGETILFEKRYPIDILAYDQWNGVSVLPEMLAAFITPNHPEIPKIIRRASAILERWTANPSFDDYQSRNPDRVRKQMAAIYEAIAELQILYCTVPASFEEQGQRVRLADAIFSQKLGNCLDMSLLYAACLEAVGITPLIIIIKGHAFTGAWLIDETFADSVNDDASLLTKRTASGINEITLVEATCMNMGKAAGFDDAVRLANQHMLSIADFGLFIDVKRARFSRIRPLPLRIATSNGFEIIEEKQMVERNTGIPIALDETLLVTEGIAGPVGKQQLWERKLLDLTLRNNLLNLRVTKGTLQFISINPAKLEDALASGDEFQILAKPNDWDNPHRSAGLYHTVHISDPMSELVQHELTQKRLRSYLSEGELIANLTALYRSSRLAIEENGASTLYIALGFLKWYETVNSEVPRYAPILLLPVEIIRKSARQGFVIRGREEEPMLNVTLLEKLRQDYGINVSGLEVLPRDNSGVDVRAIFNIIRRAVMAQSRWDVEEQVVLGTFSFSKFILWNDIHNNSQHLLKNKIVASLVNNQLQWQVVPEAERELDVFLNPSTIALPIATDSSQLDAIISSTEGKSFVLHGPPGTGKSQTITNIIAAALHAGKKVLFVAAKKAALDVVESRLESIGIGPFCLELHSNKAKKTSVIEQLKHASEVVRKVTSSTFEIEAQRLSSLRAELNEYVKALHHIWPFGISLYDAFTRYNAQNTGATKLNLPQNFIASLTNAQIDVLNDIVSELEIITASIDHPKQHLLRDVKVIQYTPQIKDDIAAALKSYLSALQNAESVIEKNIRQVCIDNLSLTRTQTKHLRHLSKTILELPDIPASLLMIDSPEQLFARIKELTKHGRRRDELKAALLQNFSNGILNINAEILLNEWNATSNKWFIPRLLGQNKIVKAIKPFRSNGILNKPDIPQLLQSVIAYREEQNILEKATDIRAAVGTLWLDENCDWDILEKACSKLTELFTVAVALTGPTSLNTWRQRFAKASGDSTAMFISAYGKDLKQLEKQLEELENTEAALISLIGIKAVSSDGSTSWLQDNISIVQRYQSGIDQLKDWTSWTNIRDKARTSGLDTVIAAYETGTIASAEIGVQYRKALYKAMAEYIIGQSSELASFNSALFEDKITRFKNISENFEKLTREELYAKLAAKIPDFSIEASQSSEVGILQKAIRSNGRAMSIRKLFDSIPNLLQRLTPCMLMSPISVAQYFDAAKTHFDLVIFDEASQMPTCEAVGAMARGSNVIVVGDPKQMPPTSFFATANRDEDNPEEDLESILDDCLALSMPSKHLLWHYRSKHESLIAFSNAKYYENKLFTFPSTDDLATKVSLVQVQGFYDKGKTRQNKAEATAIVAEILRRLAHPDLSKRSMGVVTFSSVQQNLIEDILTEEFRKAPHLEKIALEAEEPLFIKNLENVQGDERDVILFSICYGPDETGKVSLNFGPLNRDGGWRRLNVAVSRARYEMTIFSTLPADGIDLARTSAEGVAGLKAFLAFAEKGKTALPVKIGHTAPQTAGLEATIAETIRGKGYDVHLSIGCSGYRVDIGIVHPERPSEYLLGILCDGNTYKASKTARDRIVVQESVLRSLGWKLHRVWSLDWWEKPDLVLTGIMQTIEKAKAPAETSAPMANLLLPTVEHISPTAPPVESTSLNNAVASLQPVLPPKPDYIQSYEVCNLLSVATTSADAFLQPHNGKRIREQIDQVLEKESPISKPLLYQRILASWGIARAGGRIAAHLDSLIVDMGIRQTKHRKQVFLWKMTQHPNSYKVYRLSKNDAQKRDAEDLPPEEIAVAIRHILKAQLSLPKADLIRESARLFGYARLGAKVDEAMQIGIDVAIKHGFVITDGDRIVYQE